MDSINDYKVIADHLVREAIADYKHTYGITLTESEAAMVLITTKIIDDPVVNILKGKYVTKT